MNFGFTVAIVGLACALLSWDMSTRIRKLQSEIDRLRADVEALKTGRLVS